MSKNKQIDATVDSLDYSSNILEERVENLYDLLESYGLDEKQMAKIDDMVSTIQHYTYRVALSEASLSIAKHLQGVYISCNDPTRRKRFYQIRFGRKAKAS